MSPFRPSREDDINYMLYVVTTSIDNVADLYVIDGNWSVFTNHPKEHS